MVIRAFTAPLVSASFVNVEAASLIVRLAAGLSPEQQQDVISRNGGLETSAVPVLPSVTPTPSLLPTPCYRGFFVKDVTIPDGSVIAPGAAFRKNWKLQNGGTTTWTTSYSFVFISGEQMGTVASVPLTQSVSPGQQVDVSVDMVAPTANGNYQGYWKMKNASGQLFNDSVYVMITVGTGGANPTSPAGTPGATPTATSTGIPGNLITNLTMSVDEGTYLSSSIKIKLIFPF